MESARMLAEKERGRTQAMAELEEEQRKSAEVILLKRREELEMEMRRVSEELDIATENHDRALGEGKPRMPEAPKDFNNQGQLARHQIMMERYKLEHSDWVRTIERAEKQKKRIKKEKKELRRRRKNYKRKN